MLWRETQDNLTGGLCSSGEEPQQIMSLLCYKKDNDFPGGLEGKEAACTEGDPGSIPGSGRYPVGGHDNPLQYSWPGESHGERSLVGYSPGDHKESDTTE